VNNTFAGIIISVVVILSVLYGWSWWFLLPLGYAIAFTIYPRGSDKELERLDFEIEKLRFEVKKLRKEDRQ